MPHLPVPQIVQRRVRVRGWGLVEDLLEPTTTGDVDAIVNFKKRKLSSSSTARKTVSRKTTYCAPRGGPTMCGLWQGSSRFDVSVSATSSGSAVARDVFVASDGSSERLAQAKASSMRRNSSSEKEHDVKRKGPSFFDRCINCNCLRKATFVSLTGVRSSPRCLALVVGTAVVQRPLLRVHRCPARAMPLPDLS